MTFRFDQWVQRVKEFTETLANRVAGEVKAKAEIQPPLAAPALESLSSELERPLPAALKDFLSYGSGGLNFSYRWTPIGSHAQAINSIYEMDDYIWGGGEFCQAEEMVEWYKDAQELAADPDFWLAEYPEDLELWKQSLPILRMRSGDYLALDVREAADDPAVVYLSHDDESKIIAPSFTAFLTEWERLRYIGPDMSLLEVYLNAEGSLSADTDEGKILSGAFGEAV